MSDEATQVELTDGGEQLRDTLPLYLKLKNPNGDAPEEGDLDLTDPSQAMAMLFGGLDGAMQQNYIVLRVNDFDQAIGHNIDDDMFFVHLHGKDLFPDQEEAERFFELTAEQRQKKAARGDNPFSNRSVGEVQFWMSHASYPWRLNAREIIGLVHEVEALISTMLDDEFEFDASVTPPEMQAGLLGAAKAIRRGEHPFGTDMIAGLMAALEPYVEAPEGQELGLTFEKLKEHMNKPFDHSAEVPQQQRRAIFEEKLQQLDYWWQREFPSVDMPRALRSMVERIAREQEYDWIAVDQCKHWIQSTVEEKYGSLDGLHRSQRLKAAEYVDACVGNAPNLHALLEGSDATLLEDRARAVLWQATEQLSNPYSDKFHHSEATIYNQMAESPEMVQAFEVGAERNAKFFVGESMVMSPFVADSGMGIRNYLVRGVCMPQGWSGGSDYVDRVYFVTGGDAIYDEHREGDDPSRPAYAQAEPLRDFWGVMHHELSHYRDLTSLKLFGERFAERAGEHEAMIKENVLAYGKAVRELNELLEQLEDALHEQVPEVQDTADKKPNLLVAIWDVLKEYLGKGDNVAALADGEHETELAQAVEVADDPMDASAITLSEETQLLIESWLGVEQMPTRLGDARALVKEANDAYVELVDHLQTTMPISIEELERFKNVPFLSGGVFEGYKEGLFQQMEIPARLQQLDYTARHLPALVPKVFGEVWDQFVAYRDEVTRYFDQKLNEKDVGKLIQWDGMTEQLDVYQEMSRAGAAQGAAYSPAA